MCGGGGFRQCGKHATSKQGQKSFDFLTFFGFEVSDYQRFVGPFLEALGAFGVMRSDQLTDFGCVRNTGNATG